MKLAKISFIIIFLYAICWLISYREISNLPINIVGLILIFVVVPLNIINIFNIRIQSRWEMYICSILVFFIIYVPIFYSAYIYLHTKIHLDNLYIFSFLTLFISTLISIKRKRDIFDDNNIYTQKIDKREKQLVVFLFVYIAVHALNYYFYHFIPEWDGYGNILDIERILNSGSLINNYRPLYFTAVSVLSSVTNLNPYGLYQTVMICLQSSILIVLYLFMNEIKISNYWSRCIIFFSAISIPVLNMEIDMVRPQNSLIILLPIYFYLFYQSIKTKKSYYWILASLIALLGIGFHEFFALILFIQSIWIYFYLLKRYFIFTKNRQIKVIFVLTTITVYLILKDIVSGMSIYASIIYYGKVALSNILNVSDWKLWFINNYDTDGPGLQMGWPGVAGLAKYYSYYLSPVLITTLLALLLTLFRRKNSQLDSKLERKLIFFTTLPSLVFYFILSEILPRMNFTLLPDRYWFMFDIVLLIILVYLFKCIESESNKIFRKYLIIFTLSIIISIFGSFYVAKEKKALTTVSDKIASEWIVANTPDNSLFITQASNTPMINYFSRRKILLVEDTYFLDDNLQKDYLKNKSIAIQNQINEENTKIQNATEDINNKSENYDTSILIITQSVNNKKILFDKLQTLSNYDNAPLYILYSENKFSTIYNQRIWWKNVNFFGAKIEKFNYYPLVYNSDGIYIWKVK